MIDRADLRKLTGGRWLMPLMANIHAAGGGSRFAAMLAQLNLSRSVLAASLIQLQALGWIRRNAGHGHPLRPEYVLSTDGAPIAAFCERLMDQRRRLGLEPGQLPRWSLPIIAQLDGTRARFTTLRTALGVTPRALSLTLKQMLSADLVDRALEDDFPPVAFYSLTSRGDELAQAMR